MISAFVVIGALVAVPKPHSLGDAFRILGVAPLFLLWSALLFCACAIVATLVGLMLVWLVRGEGPFWPHDT